MDRKEKEIFERLESQIIRFCDPKYILSELVQEGVLEDAEYFKVIAQQTPQDRAKQLCEILPGKRGSLPIVMRCLERDEQFNFILEDYTCLVGKGDFDATKKHSMNGSFETDVLTKILHLGGVPNLPAKVLPRETEVLKVREAIGNMKHNDLFLVHGMAGAGKSVVLNLALRDESLMNSVFPQGIYWVTVGQVEKDSLLTKMQQVCERLSVPSQPFSCELASEILRKEFQKRCNRDTLVVLDDVWNPSVVKLFDVGCRIVVLSKDEAVVAPFTRKGDTVRISDCFTEQESLQLFSLHVGLPVDHLPPEAKEIHREASGSPMVVYMIGDLLGKSKSRKSGADHWSKYARLLQNKRLSLKHTTDYQYESPLEAIGMSFNALDDKARKRFRLFAAFMTDVNIPAKVLATIWDKDAETIEEYMDPFVNSTLARATWDNPTDQFIYGIHDFVLEYLRRHIQAEEIVELHRTILEKYQRGTLEYYDLPDDNYIYYFIGYHLKRSGQVDDFPKIYLDLRFIAAKLRATGPGDMINDMMKYKEYIVGDGNEKDYLDFLSFIRQRGSFLAVNPEVDVVQLGLLEPYESAVCKNAQFLALTKHTGTLYELCNKDASERSSLVVTLTTGNVTSACFTKDERRVLIGTSAGCIKLIDVKSSRVIYNFHGHSDAINHIALSRDGERFVTSSRDRTCHVWNLKSVLKEADGIENEVLGWETNMLVSELTTL